ncbi:MAG: insulinase family protein [Nitrospirae bacterium]|nr:MAG: insulinase family protein [Nitrospirota bacterium]
MTAARSLLAALALVVTVSAGFAQTAPPGDPRTMTFDPVTFTVPEVERVVLANGIIVYLLPDRELPLVTVSALVRAGSIYEPADKVGLAGLTGTVMRTGGTARLTGDQIDEELEFLAANIAMGIGVESGAATLDILKKDLPRGLAIFADMLRAPAFEPAKVELARRQALEAIRRRPDNPAGIAAREFRKLLFGADHPLGRESTTDTVSRITRDDLAAFHRQFFVPNQLMLGVTGDFEKPAMLEALRKAFGDWTPQPVALPALPAVTAGAGASRSVNILRRDLSQTHLRIGHLSVKEDDPDYFALALLEDILGGNSFTSRLFRDVRSRQGLAYSVGSRIVPGNAGPGFFVMQALTKGPSTHQALASMLDHMERLRQEPVSPEELQLAKDAFLNSFVFSFADASLIVGRLMSLEYHGLPKDFLQRFRDGVVKLTREDLLRVARAHLHPDRVVILAVGKDDDFEQPLTTFGKITVLTLKPGG